MLIAAQRSFRALSVIGLCLGLAGHAGAQTVHYRTVSDPSTQAQFNFRVTLIPVPGHIKAVKARLNFDPQQLGAVSGEVRVPLATLDTGIGLRDRHARAYLKAEQFPEAVFTLKSLSSPGRLPVGQTVQGIVNGTFSLAGISRALSTPVTLQRSASGRITVRTSFNLTLRDHGVRIPGADADTDVQVTFTVAPQ
ncbi:hypothetical protein DKM44_01265 [Deinococcus irradiatisoli]|uniref:Lipid/polyisoprenoid-binding YceI-like domain-containing protein n=1 Tax=Deinococcus irradiatisoli TaxID=2202254 RepID=A0A2Z3JAB4_9DEIO|nr:YceI family protein [Deinococcus irradiatisoli]AWN22033.1 hypothetical protein DKM44_01265 [Deinococcus irradiatisoli]